MANTIGSLVIDLVANTAKFSNDLQAAVKVVETSVESIKSAFGKLGEVVSIAGIAEFATETIRFGDELSKAASKTGLSAQAISQLSFAARAGGIDLEQFTSAVVKMEKSISDAGTGTGTARTALEALGVTFGQVKNLTPDQQFALFADRINELKSPADKARAAIEIFGRAGADLLPLFAEGADGIAKARVEAGLLGQSFTPDQLKKFHDTQVSIDSLKESFSGLGTALVEKATPALTLFLDRITAFLSGDEARKLKVEIADIQRDLDAQHSGFFSPSQAVVTDKDLLAKQLKLQAIEVINQAQAQLQNSGVSVLSNALKPPPGFLPEIEPIPITRFKIQKDGLTAFYDDLQKATMTGSEKTEDETAAFFANLDELLKDGQITLSQYVSREDGFWNPGAMASSFATYNASIADGIHETTIKYQNAFATITEDAKKQQENSKAYFEEIQGYSKTAAAGIQDAFATFLVDPFSGGLKKMLASWVQTIDQMVAKAAAAKIFQSLFGNTSGGLGGIFSSILTGSFGGAGAGASAAATAGAYDQITTFANGGSFMVGGSGGTDSQLVQFKASPNERVTVTTPGQSAGFGGGAVTVINHNYIDARTDQAQIAQLIGQSTKSAVQQATAKVTNLIHRGAFA